MLGPERFASFETPNVIDPGDDAPIQPKRKQGPPPSTPSSSSVTKSSAFPPPSYRPVSLGRTEKIQLHGSPKSPPRLLNNIHDLDLSPEEDVNMEQKRADSYDEEEAQDQAEIARKYAATLLKDANRRTSFTDLGSEEPSNAPVGGLMLLGDYSSSPSKHLVRNQVFMIGSKIAALILVLVFVVLMLIRMSSWENEK